MTSRRLRLADESHLERFGLDWYAALELSVEWFDKGYFADMLSLLISVLNRLRDSQPADEFKVTTSQLRNHPIFARLLTGPITSTAFNKSRGYSGDAETLDYIYGIVPAWCRPIDVGNGLYPAEFNTNACRSVRERRNRLAGFIDSFGDSTNPDNILSLACGHLREAALSLAIADKRAEVVGFDQDAKSLMVVGQDYRHLPIKTVRGSIARLIAGRYDLGLFDGIYSAGLFDYLDAILAARLISVLFGMLKPGGRLLIANFTPDLTDIGYMEAVQDWFLIYRDEPDMMDLATQVECENVLVSRNQSRSIVYLELSKPRSIGN